MTKVGRLFEEEKQKAVQEAIKKEKADKKKALQRASADMLAEKKSIAKKLLMDGIPVDSILKCIDGLDRAEIEALK